MKTRKKKTRKRVTQRKKSRSGTGVSKTVSYLFVNLIKLLFSLLIHLLKSVKLLLTFSIYLLKLIWMLLTFSVNLLYRFIKRIFKRNPSKPIFCTLAEIDEMDGYKFEEFMKQVYEQLGYSVYHTPFSGDQGADLILTSRKKTKIAVQIKRYSGKVSNSAVQEVVAAKGFYKCTEGIVVTNNYFTDSAKELAKANFICLVDRNELEKLISKLQN